MRAQLSIQFRLIAAMSFLGLLAIGIGIVGLIGMSKSNDAIRFAHDKQLASAIALSNTESFIARQRTSLDQAALRPGSETARYMFDREREVRAIAEKAWHDYMALPHDSKEAQLAGEVGQFMQQTESDIDRFRQAIEASNSDQIIAVAGDVGKNYTLMQSASVKLKAYQAQDAQASVEAAATRYRFFTWLVGAAILLAVLGVIYARWTIQTAIGKPIKVVLGHFQRMAAGDLSQPITVHSNDEMGQLLSGLLVMRDGLVSTVSAVRSGTHSITSATQEIAAGNMDLSSRTEEQASALQETAASMEQLSGTVSQNAENAQHASHLATSAAEVASRGREMVSTMVTTMTEINDSSSKVAEITALIEGIAFQTNILALNAAVEAARAGEQGRGFAVVAGEVRSLAQRSSAAASEIKKLITESVERTRRGSDQARDAGATIHEMNTAVERVAKIIVEISSASGEQRRGIEQISHAVSQMDAVTQQNAALVEQASATAQALDDQARVLSQSVAVFTL